MAELSNLSNVAQLTGLDAVKLIGLIVQAAQTARMHKRNCIQFANHLKLIGNLLDQLKISELKKYLETREPLEQLEDALRRSYLLVYSCQDKSYLYLLAMGWHIVYQFKKAQNEIDGYLKIVPLINLVNNARVREKLEVIERDQREYTLDEEDQKVQQVILNHDPCSNDTVVLKKTLSCSYPKCTFDEALRKENEKLLVELQRSQAILDIDQCKVIEKLLAVTHSASEFCNNEKSSPVKSSEQIRPPGSDEKYSFDGSPPERIRGSYQNRKWNTDLLDCCSEPCLCLKTCLCPCGTFSKISTVANNKNKSSGAACSDLVAYSLILSCCCYTSHVRGKLRKKLNINGGTLDDFLSHLMCCCCALVQEWREVEIRGAYDNGKIMTCAPPRQFMES